MKLLQKVWLPVMIILLIAGSVYVDTNNKKFPIRWGLDIKGGIRAVLQADTSKLPPGTVFDAGLVRQILENRIFACGITDATVQPKGADQFVIELPDVRDKNAILELLGTTAQMEFHYFRDAQYEGSTQGGVKDFTIAVNHDSAGHELYSFKSQTGLTFRDGSQIRTDFTKLLQQTPQPGAMPFTVTGPLTDNMSSPTVNLTPDQQKQATTLMTEMAEWRAFLDDSPLILKGSDIEPNSRAQMGGTTGLEPIVTQEFTDKGAQEMSEFTGAHIGDIMGIVLDDRVISAPTIQSEISDQGEISGGFTSLKEASDLANLLNAGALPVPLQQLQVENISATLGTGAVSQSEKAGAIGIGLVLVFMLVWYMLPGLLADIALIIYALFTMAIFKGGLHWLGLDSITMTTSGIAGFILSIGMAVDANILIFERLKEELRHGKSLRAAIDAGFSRAFPAIRDSNICTIITCTVLLSIGTASVRGFALTLMIGVIVSLFSAITVTRTLLYSLVDAGVANNPVLFGYRPEVDGKSELKPYNIIGRRNFFYGLSVAIILPGAVLYCMHGLKPGIDFTGGSEVQVTYNQPVSQQAVLSAALAGGVKAPLVQMADDNRTAIVTTPETSNLVDPATKVNLIQVKLENALGEQGTLHLPYTFGSFDKVGGAASAELTNNAREAVIIASLLIVFYLAIVFGMGGFVAGLRLGTSAIAAMLHDVLVLIGVFAALGYFWNWKIDSLFVTGTLTVIGFSVHNTVVIFDRVRENLRHRLKGESFEQLVNRSILQTLNRSVRTSGTVLMTLLALLIFGGDSTRALNLALFVGVLSGTYSAIFNAAAILVDWENWLEKRRSQYSPKLAAASAVASSGGSNNGGGPRPTVNPRMAQPVGMATTPQEEAIGISRIKAKKKKPARRF